MSARRQAVAIAVGFIRCHASINENTGMRIRCLVSAPDRALHPSKMLFRIVGARPAEVAPLPQVRKALALPQTKSVAWHDLPRGFGHLAAGGRESGG